MTHSVQEAKFVFLGVLFVYLCFAAGYVDTIDAEPSLLTAQSLWDRGSFLTHPKEPEWFLYKEISPGNWVSKLGITFPFLYLPCVVAARAAHTWFALPENVVLRFCVSLVNCFFTAALVGLIFFSLRTSGASRSVALFFAMAAGFATYLFPYSKTAHREPFEALCLLGPWVLLKRAEATDRPLVHYVLAGIGLSLGGLTKLPFVFLILPALVWFASRRLGDRQWLSKTACFLGPLIGGALVWLGFAKWEYGSFFDVGYNPANVLTGNAWQTPFWKGVFVQVLSPRSGLFVYNLFLLFFVAYGFLKIRRAKASALDMALLSTIAIQVAVHAKWFTPLGGESLGPRYLVVVTPLCFLLVDPCVQVVPPKRWVTALAILLFVVSTSFQFVQVCVKAQQFWSLQNEACQELPTSHWRANLIFFKQKWLGEKEVYSPSQFGGKNVGWVDLSRYRTLRGFNFWWLHWAHWAREQPTRVGQS